jgi:dipeptide transport system ATP-binding protein
LPEVFEAPRHPYTQALLAAIPEHNRGAARLAALRGLVPGAYDRPRGCLFEPRCDAAGARCRDQAPAFSDGVRCHFPLSAGAWR